LTFSPTLTATSLKTMTEVGATPLGSDAVPSPALPVTTKLEVDGITKSFGPVQVLRGISISVQSGEVLGLVGDNGAGKTTFVKCLSGILHPDNGTIRLDGSEVHIDSPKTAHSLGIETVHQDLALIETLDVTANLFLHRERTAGGGPLRTLGLLRSRRMHAEAKEILDSLHINIPSVRYPIERLSGGQRQAIAVGRAVAWGQRIVLMDEPSAALGVEQTRLVLDLVRTLRRRGVVVIFISHNMQHVLDVCSRVVVFRHGAVVAEVDAATATTRDLVDHITGSR
jgi:ABC-type sugar transport system ATPase subunit